MQVTNHTYAPQNNKYNQSFTSIKSVRCEGLYRKYPELGKELVDTFKENPNVMAFCKKYDVDVVFHAVKDGMNSVQSSVNVFYDNVAKSKFQKILDFFRSTEDKVVIHGWGNEYDLYKSLNAATENLKAAISPENIHSDRPTGLLEVHMQSASDSMEEILQERAEVAQKKLDKLNAKIQKQRQNLNDKSNLDSSIDDLINKGS